MCIDIVKAQGQVQIYILGIDELGKLQSGYLQVHRQDAARRAATGSALAQIDILKWGSGAGGPEESIIRG